MHRSAARGAESPGGALRSVSVVRTPSTSTVGCSMRVSAAKASVRPAGTCSAFAGANVAHRASASSSGVVKPEASSCDPSAGPATATIIPPRSAAAALTQAFP